MRAFSPIGERAFLARFDGPVLRRSRRNGAG